MMNRLVELFRAHSLTRIFIFSDYETANDDTSGY